MLSIFKTFFALGWISFGGPAAHIGYFRNTFVEKLNWLSDEEYAQIVALSQFLPGPGSSQVGFAIGYKKGGLPGAVAAFLGFTLPSVILMILLALLSSQLTESGVFDSVVHGLKLLAVVVVADATWGMYKNFCKERVAVFLAILTAVVILVVPGIMAQISILLFAALVGRQKLRKEKTQTVQNNKSYLSHIHWLPLILFGLILFVLPLFADTFKQLGLFSDFFQAGSLVFGGGHVVLPLLQNIVGDQISQDAFLTGYAAAQAVPGPMFTLATYLGYEMVPNAPVVGAIVATVGVFLPGFLLLLAVMDNWQELAKQPKLEGAIRGVNAAVVGLLVAALYTPVFNSAVGNSLDMAVVILGIFLLKQVKLPIVYLVGLFAVMGVILSLI
ncbi:chromate efflux transporter [Vibrio hannami]|uniref:chromate efflux transporter n=1 Tax=Vibrio hannami TaxID=2717094 RepID=UPI00240F331B|nr:chromate efflux transporter [Vibrio hannami]MDG3085783.1 chromate efflux transporter [Vibrio hannami]